VGIEPPPSGREDTVATDTEDPAVIRRIVAGFDGSDNAMAAVRWARAEAQRWDAELIVIHSWEFPLMSSAPDVPLDLAGMRQESEQYIRDAIEAAFGPDHGIEVRQVVELPARALLAAAGDADLVVVGSRGRGGLKGMLLGSVSHNVVQHAPCPVVVVR
jgi:nucleotide-binding universal stress UspA family protein